MRPSRRVVETRPGYGPKSASTVVEVHWEPDAPQDVIVASIEAAAATAIRQVRNGVGS